MSDIQHKTFKYRLYPKKDIVDKLQWTLDRCREVYNAALQERRDTWKNIKQHPSYYDDEWRKQAAKDHSISLYGQQNQLALMKKDRTEYQNLSAAHILNDVCARVDKAFKAFFRRCKQGQKPGYPRFQGRNRYDSFTYPDKSGWKLQPGEKKNGKLVLSKIGEIKIKLHRPIQGILKTVTIKREGEHWYACFACEVENMPQSPYSDEAVGIDLGLKTFATLSNGATIENPRFFRRGEKKLAKAQQALSRKKRGSRRRKKAVQKVARCHRKVRNQRRDFLHKQSHSLVRTYKTIVFEDLQLGNLSKRPKPKQDEDGKYLPNGARAKGGLNKSINDAGWSMFIAMCEYKAASAGTQVLKVNPRDTSQVCSVCGIKGPHKTLTKRTHTCAHCGIVLDRDYNAAQNILELGHRQLVSG